jgi:WD40 repeat protein
VFVSYAREDAAFVQHLSRALAERDKTIWVDVKDIPPTAEWRAEVEAAIESTDAFIAVMSPESLRSAVCASELAHAVEHNKRIIPLLHREAGNAPVPPELESRNWIFGRDTDDFDAAIEKLLSALETNLDWVHAHTRLGVRASEWHAHREDKSFLLSGSDLGEAEGWLAEHDGVEDPQPTSLQKQYVLASRRATTRRQRILFTAVLGVLAVTVALAVFAWVQRGTANTQRGRAIAQAKVALSRQLAAQAQTQQSLRPATSLMLSLEALRAADTPEAHASLQDTLLKSPFAKILAGREKPIKEVEFSADGGLVAVAGDDETVHVWQVGGATERQDVATLSGMAVSFGDGRLMATSGGRSPVLWDMSTPARPVRLAQLSSAPAGAVQLSRGRRALVDGATASLWDVSQPRRPQLLGKVPSGGRDTALSPDGRLLATANRPGLSELWDVGDATRPRLVGSIPVLSDLVVFSPDSLMLAVTSRVDKRDEVAQLWDVRNPRNPRFITKLRTASNTPAFDVDFAPDGKRAVTANFDGTASVWDISRPSAPVETTVLRGHTGAAYAADFSPDGRRIVTGSQDGTAIIWNVAPAATVQPLAQISGFEGAPEITIFSPDSRRLLVASGDLDPAAVWNVSRPDKPVRESILTPTGVGDATTNTRGDRLLTASDGTAWLWDTSDFGRPRKLRLFPGDGAGLSADGKTVATVRNGVVRLWRESGKDWQSLGSVPGDWITFSPDPDLFAVMRDGKTTLLRVSDPQHPVNAGMLTGFTPAFSGKRSLLALVDGEAIALWDVSTPSSPRKVATFPHESGQPTFNPDGTVMAIGNADGVPELWDVSDPSHPRSIARLVGHQGSAYRVAFSPDGRVLAAGSYDKSVRLWSLSATVEVLRDPVTLACAIAGPGLPQADWTLYFPGQTYRRSCPG